MVGKLQDANRFTEDENAAVIEVLHKLKKKNGYSYQELSRLSGISMGGLIGLRKSTQISPNIATKLAETFGYDNWQDMLEEDQKKERRKAKPPVSKDWKEMMEARVAELERLVTQLKKDKSKNKS
jgi:transcriptional regulator with XRE-family HTH domain